MTEKEKQVRKDHNERLLNIIGNYKLFKIRLMEKRKLTEQTIIRYERYLKRVDYCIEKMSSSVRTVFENSFLENNMLYILGFYSESQYYRLKARGREEFLVSFRGRLKYD